MKERIVTETGKSNYNELKKQGYTLKPILFSTKMVQAILVGSKTQTRRVINPQPYIDNMGNFCQDKWNYGQNLDNTPNIKNFIYCRSKANINDIFWVRETWMNAPNFPELPEKYYYKASKSKQFLEEWKGCWKPSIFMPKEAARIFLKVKNVQIERLEDISKEDAIAEGIEKWEQMCQTRYKSYVEPMVGFWDDGSHLQTSSVHPAIASFRSLWASINGFDSLNSNPWVFVYEFEYMKNI